ncbi:hypothetical protein [Taklimakanibacter lacteus]|uniref:hypothetical protein n=1 Tax=Taklimakanibacter lacteus TaxID=2268456 RepID=UPI000E65F836
MGDMSPLGKLILTVMLWGVRFAAAAIAAIAAIFIWQKWLSAADEITRQDYTFLAILVALLIAALWFARSLARELRR